MLIKNKSPLISCFNLLFLCLIFRVLDIFVFRLDEALGEIILSKSIGFLLILLFLYLRNEKLKSIGLHNDNILINIVIGLTLFTIIYIIAYSIEYFIVLFKNLKPTIVIAAIDPKQGVNGGLLFGLWLMFGNIINSLMEEGLFRGYFISRFNTKYSFLKSNLIQAILFGIWHLVWPLKSLLVFGESTSVFIFSSLSILVATTIMGFVWGYMFYKSKSLLVPIAAHFVANSIQNIVHINSVSGLDAYVTIRGILALILSLLTLLLFKKLYRKLE